MANPTPPAIPGFYWDEEKSKYFRITAAHHATQGSAAAKYTQSGIFKKHASVAAEKYRQQWSHRLHTETVRRSRILRHGLSTCLRREVALHASFETYASHFGISGFEPLHGHAPKPVAEELHLPRPFVQDLVRHAASDKIFAAYFDRSEWSVLSEHSYHRTKFEFPDTPPIKKIILAGSGSNLLLMMHSQGLISMLRHNVHAHDNLREHYPREFCGRSKPNTEHDTFDAALQPHAAHPLVLIGSDQLGLYDIERETFSYANFKNQKPSDILSVQWQNMNIMACGQRNGGVKIGDIRVKNHFVNRIEHPSTITHLRYADTSPGSPRIVVAGLGNHLRMYDLRYCRKTDTKAWIKYSGYENQFNICLGLDINPMLGIVAAARDRGGVAVLDLWRGSTFTGDSAFNNRLAYGVPRDRNRPSLSRGEVTSIENTVGCIVFDRQEDFTMDGEGYCLIGEGPNVRRCVWGRSPRKKRERLS